MRLARNMAAAMANSVVVVLINLVALPFYLRYLGMEAYGLIGFYATLQTVLQVLDLGLAPTVSREIAHNAEICERRRSASLLRTLGYLYIAVAVAIAGLVALASPWIGAHWLQAQRLPESTIAQAVALMGLNLACRWPISLYHGALAGSHRLALSSAVSMTMNIAAATTAILVLAYGERSIQAFFVVQAAYGLLHATVLRIVARRVVGERDAPVDFDVVRGVWKFSAWMGGIGIAGLVLTQVDKLVLSRILPLPAFGHYMLATLIVSGFQVLTMPMFNTLFPKFSALLARGDIVGLERLYGIVTRIYATALFALAFLLAFHTGSLVMVWLGDATIAASVAPLAVWLAVGTALNGLMYIPYALQLAAGKPRLAFAIVLGLLVLMVPLVVFLALRFGALGGALAWAVLGVLYLPIGTWLTGRRVMAFAGWPWLRANVVVPMLATLVPALIGAWICRTLGVGPWGAVGVGCVAAVVGACLALATSFRRRGLREIVALALGKPSPSR